MCHEGVPSVRLNSASHDKQREHRKLPYANLSVSLCGSHDHGHSGILRVRGVQELAQALKLGLGLYPNYEFLDKWHP